MAIPAAVLRRAAKQGGYITRAQLIDLGLSTSAVDRRIDSGDFNTIVPSLYQVFASDDHTDLIRGAQLALPDAVASHQSAALLLAFPVLPKIEPTVTVPSHTTHRFPNVTVRRCADMRASHLATADGIRVTTIARTVFDLAGVLVFEEFERITEALLLAGRMDMRQLERMIEALARRGKPGSRTARDFVTLRSGSDSRSTRLERLGRSVLSSAGLPSPVAQYAIPWRSTRRFDDAYPESKLAIEWDSRSWHSQRDAMRSDRQRDREAALHGWIVVRFTWQDVTERPDEVSTAVRTLLAKRMTG
jgi:hypothetical protein